MNGTNLMKKMVATLLALVLLMGLIGCGKTTSDSSNGSTASQSTASQSTAGETQAEEKTPLPTGDSASEMISFEAIEVPLPEEPLMKYPVENGGKLSMWAPFNSTASKYYQSYAESPTVIQYMKDTGIEIEFIHPPSGQAKENFNLLVVSDSLPDIVVNTNTYYSGGDVAGVADGVFADLTDLIAENAPDYNYFLEKNDLFRKLATTSDNKVYSLYAYKDVQAPFYIYPQFRADWLEEWNMEIPFLLSEYETYFDKVLAEKPDVAPYLPDKSGLEGHLLGTFGIGGADNGYRFFLKDGMVHHTFQEPNLKAYLTLMRDWYTKGYISKDFITVDNKETEFSSNKAGMVIGNVDVLFTLSKELDIDVISGRYPRINPDDLFHFDIFYFPQNGMPTSINAKSPNIENAMKFLNYGYTKQGSGVVNFGETDVTWIWGDDGNPQFTDFALHNDKFPLSDAEYTLRLHNSWAKYRYGDDISMIRNVAQPDTWAYRARWENDETSLNDYALPALSFTPESATEIGRLTTDINTYAEEMVLKFITGAESMDQFEEFQATVNKLGMDRLLELYQESFEIFLRK